MATTEATLGTYQGFYAGSVADPERFWGQQAKNIDWHKPYKKVLEYSNPPFRKWFVGGETNLCYNAIDRHLPTRSKQAALVWISTEVDATRSFTYGELHEEVNRFAAVLKSLGVGKGDRVLIYLPMTPEAVFAMLACARHRRVRWPSRRPIRSTSSTPRAPRAPRRAWCATTAATPSRSPGRWRTSTTSTRAT